MKTKHFLGITLLPFLLVSFDNMKLIPLKEKVNITVNTYKKLPIDGLYLFYVKAIKNIEPAFGVTADAYVRLENGTIFYEDRGFWGTPMNVTPGELLVKDITKITQHRYKGTFVFKRKSPLEVTILVDGNNLKINEVPMGMFEIKQTLHFEFVK